LKVVVIPLDSRPCNYSWVKKYADYASIDLTISDFEKTGDLHKGFDTDNLDSWLFENCQNTDTLLVSIDAITSGGLIQARQGTFSIEQAIKNVDYLKKVKEMYPTIKIHAFDTIMRTSITAYDEETSRYWALINEYSRILGENHFNPKDEYKKRIKELEDAIPERVLNSYLDARNKKHQINKYLIDLVENNIVEYCVLLQEDTQPSGIQVIENDILNELVVSKHLGNRISIYNGTDEGTVILLAKILFEDLDHKPSVHFMFPDEKLKSKVMKFEDREVYFNCLRLAGVVGFEIKPIQEADYVIPVYTEDNNYDLDLSRPVEVPLSDEKKYLEFISKTNHLIKQGRKVGFVDLHHPNGGSLDLLKKIDFDNLLAYSAWNTASNALGSLIALLGVHAYNPNTDLSKFLYERIIDDCIFQTEVRRKINAKLIKENINIYDLGKSGSYSSNLIDSAMKVDTDFLGEVKYKIVLPWNRTFEIDIDME